MTDFPIKVDVEQVSEIKRRLDIVVPEAEVAKAMDQAYRDLGKRAKVKGFRPGKIPRSVLELYYKRQVEEDVSDSLVRRSLGEACKEKGLNPVNLDWPEPVPPVVAGQDFQFRVDMEVPPEFTVADYKGMTLTDMPAEVTDAEVDARMEEIRQSNAMLKPVAETRGIAEGDFAVLSYQGYYGGEALTEAKGENTYMEVGAGKFSIDFERQLLGLTAGGESRFTVDLPQDFFNPLLAGKVIEFAVTIHEIKQKVVPDLDDAFAQSLGGNFTDLADLRKQVQEDIIRRKEGERQARLEAQLAEQLIAANPFEVPPSLVTQEQEAMLNEQMSRMQQHGLSIAGMDKEKLLEAMKPRAEQRVRVGLILERLADQEGVSVDEAEVNAALGRLAVAARQEPAKVRQFYEERQLMGGLKRQLLEEKVKKMILDQATLTPAAPSEEKA